MDTHHDLTKKTTILFSPSLYRHLEQVAKQRQMSVGHLVRDACEAVYGNVNKDDRVQAVEDLARLALPIDKVSIMKREWKRNINSEFILFSSNSQS